LSDYGLRCLRIVKGIWICALLSFNLAQTIWAADTLLPENDNFADALTVVPGTITTPSNLASATIESGEPTIAEQTGSVWYRWLPSASGKARISAYAFENYYLAPVAFSRESALSEESIFYPGGGIWHGGVIVTTAGPGPFSFACQFTVFRGTSFADFVPIASGWNLEFNVEAGEVLWIALQTYPLDFIEVLPHEFFLDLTPPPANDSFSSSFSVEDSAEGFFQSHHLGATRELSEPDLGPNFAGNSVWFHYTAATYGNVTIGPADAGSTFAIFTGDQLSNLKLVASTDGGSVTFFGEPQVVYHIAVYSGPEFGFQLTSTGPKYRLYETTIEELMPGGLVPHFYGLRGNTLLLYAKTADAWRCVEIEPIKDFATEFLIFPTAEDGQLRVLSIDTELPSPHINLRSEAGRIIPELIGFPGQSCAVSFSSDLMNWSFPTIHTLDVAIRALEPLDLPGDSIFYRVTQSFPATDAQKKEITPP
jgi:hypothetical protein